MGRKSLYLLGVVLILFALQSCQQKPEEGLLKRYFHANMLNDVTTMSTIALEPVALEAESWDIISVSEEKVEPFKLAELNKTELDFKKQLEDHVGPTLDAKDLLDIAKDELESARTKAARAAAQRKVDDLQVKYDEEYEIHKELQKNYNDAKAEAAREEEIATFSLGRTDLMNIRELAGQVHSKEVEVKIETTSGEIKNYMFFLRMYDLKDETLNLSLKGRWIIVRFVPIT